MKQFSIIAMVIALAVTMMAQAPATVPTPATNDNEEWNDSILDAMADSMSVALGEVEVTAQRLLVKNEVDRLSYDVSADAESRTSTLMDMLKKVPLVSVDAQDDIKVKGSSSFKIYKNGHPDPSLEGDPKNVLKAIPASMIKRIEVITEPGAKYDAEGVTAIINIVMNTSQGMSGVTGTLGAGIDIDGSPNINGYLTTQLGKVVASVNYGFVHRPKRSGETTQTSDNTYVGSGNHLHSDMEGKSKVNVHYGNIELSYEPDTLNLISASLGGFAVGYDYIADNSTLMTDPAGATIYRYASRYDIPSSTYMSFDGRLDYQHNTHLKGEKLTTSYMFNASRNKSNINETYGERYNFPVSYDHYLRNTTENFQEHTLQFDWTRPIASMHTLETGAKYIYRRNTSHTLLDYGEGSMWNDDNRFRHVTQVAAAYASWTTKIGAVTARAGLRYEFSRLQASYPNGEQEGFHRNLSDWVPSASINWQMSPQNSLKVAFATRINRPGISYLNPAIYDTPTEQHFGNAHLGSARNYSVSATFMHIGPKFTFNVSPSLMTSSNGITEVSWAEGDKKVTTYENTLTNRQVGISGYAQWQLHPKTSFMFNGRVGRNYVRSTALGLKNARWSTFFYAQITQQLPWKLTLTANAGQWGGDISGLYGYMGTAWFYGLSLQRSFLKEDRLTVRLSAHRPFSSDKMEWSNYTTQGDVLGSSTTRYHQARLSLNVTWRFGSLRARVKKTDTTIDNNDLVGGSSQGAGGAATGGNGQQGM